MRKQLEDTHARRSIQKAIEDLAAIGATSKDIRRDIRQTLKTLPSGIKAYYVSVSNKVFKETWKDF